MPAEGAHIMAVFGTGMNFWQDEQGFNLEVKPGIFRLFDGQGWSRYYAPREAIQHIVNALERVLTAEGEADISATRMIWIKTDPRRGEESEVSFYGSPDGDYGCQAHMSRADALQVLHILATRPENGEWEDHPSRDWVAGGDRELTN